jgi:hypothetical protein
MTFLILLVGLVNFVLAIIVLIRLFRRKGILHGILGLICMLYTFIWGWMKAKEENLTTIMIAWTACILINVALSFFLNSGS